MKQNEHLAFLTDHGYILVANGFVNVGLHKFLAT